MSPPAWLRRINSFRTRLGLDPLREVPAVAGDQPFMPSADLEDSDFDEQNRAWFAGTALMDPASTVIQISRNVKAVTVTIG